MRPSPPLPTPRSTLATRGIAACLVLATAVVALTALAPQTTANPPAKPSAPAAAKSAQPPLVGQGRSALPPPVAEMRDAIIHAARSGNLDELLVPIQWNELPPDFGDHSIKDTLARWKKNSPDGSGREWLALLINLLEAPYAVLPQGRDVENAKVYIWPAFAELPLDQLAPPLEVELLRLVPLAEARRMKSSGAYDGFGLAISAGGVWLAFKPTGNLAKTIK